MVQNDKYIIDKKKELSGMKVKDINDGSLKILAGRILSLPSSSMDNYIDNSFIMQYRYPSKKTHSKGGKKYMSASELGTSIRVSFTK